MLRSIITDPEEILLVEDDFPPIDPEKAGYVMTEHFGRVPALRVIDIPGVDPELRVAIHVLTCVPLGAPYRAWLGWELSLTRERGLPDRPPDVRFRLTPEYEAWLDDLVRGRILCFAQETTAPCVPFGDTEIEPIQQYLRVLRGQES